MVLQRQYWLIVPFRSDWFAYTDIDGTVMDAKSLFTPIPALWANATDVFLFFLSANDIKFVEGCDDPWYAATTFDQKFSAADKWNATYCYQDEPARVLECVSRHQFCNADSNSTQSQSGKSNSGQSCTPLAGFDSAVAAADAVWQTDEQRHFFNASFNKILYAGTDISTLVSVAGITSLKARDKLFSDIQGPLPNNQWQVEVENWYDATLADLQRLTVEYATDFVERILLQLLRRSHTENEHQLCHNVVSIFNFFFFKVETSFLIEDQLTLCDDTENSKRRCHFV